MKTNDVIERIKLTRREFTSGTAAVVAGAAGQPFAFGQEKERQAMGALATEGRGPGILVPERFIPTPRSISPQAQAFLSHQPPVEANPAPQSVDDKAAWRAYAERGNRAIESITASYVKTYPAQLTTHQLSSCALYEVTPSNLAAANKSRAIFYVHGGGFIVGGGRAAAYAAMQMAGLAQIRTFAIDYRKPPDFPYPTPLADVVEGYRFLYTMSSSQRTLGSPAAFPFVTGRDALPALPGSRFSSG